MRTAEPGRRARRHVHLGERIRAVESIRSGRATLREASLALGVTEACVREWLRVHAADHTLYCDEILAAAAGERGRLERRVRRLQELLAGAERTLRGLHVQLVLRNGHGGTCRSPNATSTTRKGR